jgi:PBSX family phage terminase large subunit
MDRYITIVMKGGRNSGKSTTASIWIIKQLMQKPINALVVRKVGNTLHDSVFEQLKEAIEILGVADKWQIRISPMSLKYTETGTRIIFRGADKPEKIKSIKTSKYPIAILWVEELAEFRSEEEVSVIVNSVIRAELGAGLKYTIIFTYNPPKRKQNWVNKKYNTQFISSKVFVHHSTYLDNPYVSHAFIIEAEEAKQKTPHKYKWIYLGEPIGGGVIPFENLTFRTILSEEIAIADNIKQGIDWGYAADAFAFVRWYYDRTRRRLYALDEHYGVKLSNASVAMWIKSAGYNHDLTVADSAEPKSIDELRTYGINITGAKKGPGSVESGEKWLDELEEIIIDYARTPNIAREFESIDYQVDKDGNVKSKLEDFDNHTIDATRYACEDELGRGDGKGITIPKEWVGFGGTGMNTDFEEDWA